MYQLAAPFLVCKSYNLIRDKAHCFEIYTKLLFTGIRVPKPEGHDPWWPHHKWRHV